MQEVRRFTWCDVCATESPDDAPAYEPGETHTVAVDTDKPMTIDLCDRHHKALVAPLVELLAVHGYRGDMAPSVSVTPKAARAKLGQVHPCLWCPETYGSTSGLGGHLHAAHGFPGSAKDGRANLSAIYGVGGGCPYCGRALADANATRLGIHMARGHDGEPSRLAPAFVRVRDLGDPHGIVAKVAAQCGPDGQYINPRRKR